MQVLKGLKSKIINTKAPRAMMESAFCNNGIPPPPNSLPPPPPPICSIPPPPEGKPQKATEPKMEKVNAQTVLEALKNKVNKEKKPEKVISSPENGAPVKVENISTFQLNGPTNQQNGQKPLSPNLGVKNQSNKKQISPSGFNIRFPDQKTKLKLEKQIQERQMQIKKMQKMEKKNKRKMSDKSENQQDINKKENEQVKDKGIDKQILNNFDSNSTKSNKCLLEPKSELDYNDSTINFKTYSAKILLDKKSERSEGKNSCDSPKKSKTSQDNLQNSPKKSQKSEIHLGKRSPESKINEVSLKDNSSIEEGEMLVKSSTVSIKKIKTDFKNEIQNGTVQ